MRRIGLDFELRRPTLACGADTKGAFLIGARKEAFLFDGYSDLGEIDNLNRYETDIRKALKKLRIRPRVIACDLHPGYFSSRFAENLARSSASAGVYKVQHHRAHVASAIVDNRIDGDIIGIAFDGTGFGTDGNIWGGEFFVGNLRRLERAAHFEYLPMPGGEQAIRQPWRMALSCLYKAFGRRGIGRIKSIMRDRSLDLSIQIIDKGVNSPLTSSAGRFFDAAGSLILGKPKCDFEAELPIGLEKIADGSCDKRYRFRITYKGGVFLIDPAAIMKGVFFDMMKGAKRSVMSAKFHNTMARALLEMSLKLRKKTGITKVALTGGVFGNRFLTSRAAGLLKSAGFGVFVHKNFSCGDDGIPVGQLAAANAACI